MNAIYDYMKMHLSDWFPGLPSYQVFNNRLCFLADTLREFSVMLAESLPYEAEVKTYLMDSMPIVVAKGVRSNQARVANEFCNKGYCSSQQIPISKNLCSVTSEQGVKMRKHKSIFLINGFNFIIL